MRRALLLTLALAASCGRPFPAGVERIAGLADGQAYSWSPDSRRLAYVSGRFPDRTYLCVHDLASGSSTKNRLKGFVLGNKSALSRDGRRVLLEAGKVGPHASRNEPSERVLLLADARTGKILQEVSIARGGVAALGHPEWSPDPVAVWNGKEGLLWRAFGAERAGGVLRGPSAWRALLLDRPYLIAAEKQTERPRLTVYDLRDGRQAAEWRVALTASPLAQRPDGAVLVSRWMSESGIYVLESGDPKTGRRSPLLEAEGEIETTVETAKGLYAVAKDTSRRNTTGKDFLAPRVLLVIGSDGIRWSVPWTAHRGEFLGADPVNGRLLFAVTDRDRPGVWAIAPTRAALTAAGSTIDGSR